MCGTASRMIFAKLNILKSSGGWSTHGATLNANVQCAKVNQFYFAFFNLAFADISFYFFYPSLLFTCSPFISSLL